MSEHNEYDSQYITKSQAIQAIQAIPAVWETGDITVENAKSLVKRIPNADVAPVIHGKWLRKMRGWVCSVCRRFEDNPDDAPYCRCGAKMGGGEKRSD